MSIAIPIASGKLSAHFGHCEHFALVEVNEFTRTIVGQSKLEPPPHEPSILPKWLHEQGVQVIIAAGMGQRALDLFADQDIRVVVGAPEQSPQDLVLSYLTGLLKTGENVCDHQIDGLVARPREPGSS